MSTENIIFEKRWRDVTNQQNFILLFLKLMSFFSQAQRITFEAKEGPGPASHCESLAKDVPRQCAPFGSTLVRSKSSGHKHVPPGPGAYNLEQRAEPLELDCGEQKIKIAAQQKYQSVFKSRIQRLAQPVGLVTPGPGSYNLCHLDGQSNTTSAKKQRQQRYKNQFKPWCQAVPSIPDKIGKGYKVKGGKLVKIDETIKEKSLGPGFYTIKEEHHPTNVINWNYSSVEHQRSRKGNISNLISQYMGPGRYNPEQYLEPRGISSSFVSKAKRICGVEKSPFVPGPGYYESDASTVVTSCQDKHFGSKDNRFRTVSTDCVVPGPGEYFKSQETNDAKEEEIIFLAVHRKQVVKEQVVPPGPGSYQISSNILKVRSAVSLNHPSRKGDLFPPSDTPGPGQYNPSIPSKAHFMKPLHTLSSFRPQQYSAPCSPSKLYNIENHTISHKLKMSGYQNPQTNHNRPFNSGAKRFNYSAEHKGVEGNSQLQPGKEVTREARELRHREERPGTRVSFNIGAERYKATKDKLPGPGKYETDLDWLKGTFNARVLSVSKK